jgi:hypothetical protein
MTTIFMVILSYPQALVLIELARAIAPEERPSLHQPQHHVALARKAPRRAPMVRPPRHVLTETEQASESLLRRSNFLYCSLAASFSLSLDICKLPLL